MISVTRKLKYDHRDVHVFQGLPVMTTPPLTVYSSPVMVCPATRVEQKMVRTSLALS